MRLDLAINPFGADVGEMVRLAEEAEACGVDGLWVPDHFSGAVLDAPWSRDPFVVLGAWAATTTRVRLGPLVANLVNRHPAQLASATDTVRSLAPGRVVLGVGSGAAPGSRFAVEQEAIGRCLLGDPDDRRAALRSTVGALRAIWRGDRRFAGGPATSFDALTAVVDGHDIPPIIVGASAWPTVEVAIECADGVNLRRTRSLGDHLRRLADRPAGFEVSVLDGLRDVIEDPSRVSDLDLFGVDRLVLGVSPPFPFGELAAHVERARPEGPPR